MIYTIKNECLEVEIKSLGAEIKSIRDIHGRQYMWSGDSNYWGKTSPILFPVVGTLKDGKYTYNGNDYEMGRHGFARDTEFEVEIADDDAITFYIMDTEETYKVYPFNFKLEVRYELEGSSLNVIWKVTNLDEKKMYYSLGGHPAFACPLETGKRTECFIKYEGANEIKTNGLDLKRGLTLGTGKTYPLEDGYMKITEDLFNDDALVIENNQTQKVSLCDEEKKVYLSVEFDAPLFGIWSVPDSDASYVCIEPWYGRADSVDFEGSLEDREWSNSLEAGESSEKKYTITIHD